MSEEKIIDEQPTSEKIESAEDVVTEPSTEETEQPKDYVQLEQRVSSLEQRLQSLEESSRETEESSDPNFEDKTEPTEVEDDQESSNIESTDDVKEMLDL